ncbi:MAG: hypothetical protein ABSC93_16045 [Bryobacteraceae bacterium]|jgi:hypothetical protein
MDRTNLFFKVVIEHDREDDPERLGREISRQVAKVYGVRSAELTSFTRVEE